MNAYPPQFYGPDGLWSMDGQPYRQWSTGNNGYCGGYRNEGLFPTRFGNWGPTSDYNPTVKKSCLKKTGDSKPAGRNLNCEISVQKVKFSLPVADETSQRDVFNKVGFKQGYQNRSTQSNPKPNHFANPAKGVPASPPKRRVCGFCRQNGERRDFFLDHPLKDADGKVVCPVLMEYICPSCGATGKDAHTKSYCPLNLNKPEPLAVKLKKTNRDSCGRYRNRK